MHSLDTLEPRVLFSGSTPLSTFTPPNTVALPVVNVGETPRNNSDFNRDGHNDLFLRDLNIGFNFVEVMRDGVVVQEARIRSWGDTEWRAVAVADFTGDGKPDILFRNIESGRNRMWKMNGFARTDEINIPRFNLNWRLAGTGDFTGDGRVDLFWRNTKTGQNVVWEMNNTTHVRSHTLRRLPQRQWLAAGVGDFTGDGKPDILFRSQVTGQNVVWQMNRTAFVRSHTLPTRTDQDWQVGDVKDFDGDGDADIVFHNADTGELEMWFMSRLQRADRDDIGDAGTNWRPVGAGIDASGTGPTRDQSRPSGFFFSWQSGDTDDDHDTLGGVSIVITL